MASVIKLKNQAVCEDEREEMIHEAFVRRQDLMWTRPIWDEEITVIDTWLIQQHPPVEILIVIYSRAAYCEWMAFDEASPEQKHRTLLSLRECYREFQKLPQQLQEALWPIGFGRWQADFMDEEERAAHA